MWPDTTTRVSFDAANFWVELTGGRTLGIPLLWYPRLLAATPKQRNEVWLSSRGLHWEDIDEDISVEGLLAGKRDQTKRRLLASNPLA